MRRSLLASLLALVTPALVACGTDATSVPDAGGIDASTSDVDAAPGRDSGPPRDAGPFLADAGPCETRSTIERGAPIEAEPTTWTFVEFPDARCMNGSATGIGVSLSTASPNVMIFLDGGGVCFDSVTCLGVAYPNGFGAADLMRASSGRLQSGIFDRSNPDNPVRDWSFVFVPYCTGDIHGGNRTMGSGFDGRTQQGFVNIGEYLERLVPTFEGADQVLLTGLSAGGFGALTNFDQVQRAFGCTPVVLLDDSGPPMTDAYMRPCVQTLARDTWGLDDGTVPADCPQCTGEDGGGLVNVWRYVSMKYPETRIGLLSSTGDQTIRQFFGYGYFSTCDFPGNMPAEEYAAGLAELRETVLEPLPNVRSFVTEGESHTYIQGNLSRTMAGGVTLAEWIRQLLEGDSGWSDVGP